MFPILYEKNEVNFISNGIGILKDTLSATATEELNGQFELHLEYDSDGLFADTIANDMVIKAKANDKQDPQLFRIYSIKKDAGNDNIVIEAQHITYDAAWNFVESLELDNKVASEAMAAIQNNLAYPSNFIFSSTNTTTKSSTKLYRTNPLQMIAGMDGSILDNWGGEIERDNFQIILHVKRGQDDGVTVAYKKNLTGLVATFDISNVVTRIYPFKITEDGQVITIPGKYINSPNINAYPFIRIKPVDYSSDEDVIDKNTLLAKSSTYFNSGTDDIPSISMDVEFEALWATEEYKDMAVLELIGMGDTITVHHSKLNIDLKAHAIKIEYDVISEKNSKVTVGDIQARLTDSINSDSNDIQSANQTATAAQSSASQAQQTAANAESVASTAQQTADQKADKIYVDNQLKLKADKTYTDTQLELKADTDSFQASLKMGGFQKLSSGLIIQWGKVTEVQPETLLTINLPTPYLNQIFSITANAINNNTSIDSGVVTVKEGTNLNTIMVLHSLSTTLDIFWVAIGY